MTLDISGGVRVAFGSSDQSVLGMSTLTIIAVAFITLLAAIVYDTSIQW